ncbi:acyl-CoA thioesterase [Mycolicibacterium confluentis]|uniref:Acyl-CoA thioesterase II n=1 Tax=Mycolicibacterium confluentis TaxID=28047 RepID=A0A7I7XTK1_9MYCO|nr:acyl-CoA thioesterase domain-containing protein [Mycolicibacterium confluentis]MCV7319420.1 thioesterase family protein [Mycolicibacterium confluentis]BBZ32501.1 acyl-CoA thioesterase II [Mycolicibacterium confluentis]
MAVSLTELLACLRLRRIGDEADGTLLFDADNLTLDYRRVFGGQILGQFVAAAQAACPEKSVKSMHCVFPREGQADEPLRYTVQRQHEGRSFATLALSATQPSAVVGSASVSMHALENGREHQDLAYCGGPVPAPPGPEHRLGLDFIPWETRSTVDLGDRSAGPPEFELWQRTPPVPDDLHAALTAYATDLTLIGTALRPLDGYSQSDTITRFTSAVTSHSMWFHRPFRTADWLLLRQHSPILAGGRTFGRGDVLTRDGVLVASYAQEALVRFLD